MESEKKEKDEEELGFLDVMKKLQDMKAMEKDQFEASKIEIKNNNKALDKFAEEQGKLIGEDDAQSMEFFSDSEE